MGSLVQAHPEAPQQSLASQILARLHWFLGSADISGWWIIEIMNKIVALCHGIHKTAQRIIHGDIRRL